MALLQLTFIPMGTSTPSVGDYVAAVQRRLQTENVRFKLNDMGTLLEGDPKELLGVVAELYDIPFEHGLVRMVTHITMDDRRDKTVGLGDKISTVQKRLNQS